MHKEVNFEDGVEMDLVTDRGYHKGDHDGYDPKCALFPAEVVDFVQRTQPRVWQRLKHLYSNKEEETLLAALVGELAAKGALEVLRHGFKCAGKRVRLAYFAPNTGMNPEAQVLYDQNRLTVARQVKLLSGAIPDILLSVNGLPVVCIELKNQISGAHWDVETGKEQYRNDRDPGDPLFVFKQRCLVYFAVDTDEAAMTTRLQEDDTRFLPFNRGHNDRAGNPLVYGDVRTSYLWQEVLTRDSLLDILARFLHLQVKETVRATDSGLVREYEESMIFPRYHQLDVVRRLVDHAQTNGSGHNYLIQHSAGSGKSNSIAWLAHRLASLHDSDDKKVFDTVIVITDRRVLDQQLQDTIYQFDHKQGVVQKIDENTQQLAQALSGGVPIIISTLQKFPFISQAIRTLEKHGERVSIDTAGKRYAVIVDEAHSSQGGETAMELRKILNREGIEAAVAAQILDMDEDEEEDLSQEAVAEMMRSQMRRSRQPNLSYFAFTATPKYKTLAVFDEPSPSGQPPFHRYSMRQAIEEGYILDVLKHFVHYERYFKLLQDAPDDPDVPRRRAARALARFVDLHPHNITQKVEIIVEHFREHTRHKIGGRAKAMVVTASREMAVRYKLAFDRYIQEKEYRGILSLVAFSGTVVLDEHGVETRYTEPSMNNGISERELPDRFATDEYQVLLVADKYQTGFDQPLLHTMYVDKRLSGIRAVQTFSRLNRKAPGKDDTFILDFVNKPEEIYEAFKPFYEVTEMGEEVDPQRLNDLSHTLDGWRIYYPQEITAWCQIWYGQRRKQTKTEHRKLNSILDRCVERYKGLAAEEQEQFKGQLSSFCNLYLFLAQVIPYQDSELERLYTFGRFLLAKLPKRRDDAFSLDDEVQLEYYRLQKISEGSIDLVEGDADPLTGPADTGTGRADEKEKLSTIIDVFNERFGTDWGEAERLFIEQIWVSAAADEGLQQAHQANTQENFRPVLDNSLDGIVIGRMEGNEEITMQMLNNSDYREQLLVYLLDRFKEG